MNDGFAIIPNWLIRSTEVSGAAKLVYACLTSRANEHGICYPSHALLAAETGTSVSTVQRALRDLRDLGLVTWEVRKDGDGGQSSNLYRVEMSRTNPLGQSDRGVGQGDVPPRSQGPTPSVTVTDEEEPPKKTQRKNTHSLRAVPDDADREFEEWWEAYDHKVGKGQARKAYLAARQKADAATLLEGAHRAVQARQGKEVRYWPHPSTWLNGERWADEAPSNAVGNPGGLYGHYLTGGQ